MTSRILLPFTCMLLLGACADREANQREAAAARTAEAAGVYRLVATGGGPIPAVLGEREGCTYSAAGGHVALFPDTRYEAVLLRSRDCATPEVGADTVFQDQGLGGYQLSQDSVKFQFATGGTSGYGVFRGDTLVVQGTGQTLYYVLDPELSEQLMKTLDTDTTRAP